MSEEFDPTLPLIVQHCYEAVSARFSDPRVKNQVLAMLIRDGTIDIKDLKESIELSEKLATEAEKAQRQRQAAQETQRRENDAIDSKYPRIFAQKGGNPSQLIANLKTVKTEEIAKYAKELQQQPAHWQSVFHGKVLEAIDLLQRELSSRQNSQLQRPPIQSYAT